MKKVLSFVLVLAMVLGSVAMAFAVDYSDVNSESKNAEAIETLSNLGVLNGYEDGTFKAERTIKRSEFAKVVVEALGLTTSAAATAPFSDVPAGKWYTPYVALAAQLNIVNGFGDGTFRPDQTITDTQAIVMVVRALGYTDEYFGGYNAANYISRATALGLMDEGVKAGTGESTRGNVAQLVYNALDVTRVYIDKDGVAQPFINGDTMQKRLSGSPYLPDAAGNATPFLFVDQAVAAGANMKAYQGKYITATTKDGGVTINGVKTVLSKTLVGTFDGAETFKTTDDKSYTISFPTGATGFNATNAGIRMFTNGVPGGAAGAALSTAAGLSIEVAVNGVYITAIYSQSVWDATGANGATIQVAKDTLDTDKCTFDGKAFTKNNQAKIDETSFVLEGVDKLADIAVDNIVTYYVGGGVITKMEVGTKTVEGQCTEKTSAGKYVIAGTSYEMFDDATYAPALGDKGTFLLAYDGTVFGIKEAEEAEAAVYYGVKYEMVNGSTGINTSTAKVQLFTADGSKVILTGDSTAAKNGSWTPAALVSTTEEVVTYTLNADGQVHSIATFAGINSAAGADVAKDGTIALSDTNNYKLTANSKLIVKNGAKDYAAAKAADYYGKKVTLSAVAVKGTEVLFGIIDGVGTNSAAGNYVLVTGYTSKYASTGNYTELNVFEAGAAKSYKDSESAPVVATATAVVTDAAVKNYTVDTNGFVTAVANVTADAVNYTTKTAVQNGFVVADSPAHNYQISSSIVVYVYKDGKWSVGSSSDLAVTNGTTKPVIQLFETNSNAEGYDIATVIK